MGGGRGKFVVKCVCFFFFFFFCCFLFFFFDIFVKIQQRNRDKCDSVLIWVDFKKTPPPQKFFFVFFMI